MSDRIPISVLFVADFTCPWCLVGWEALKRAAAARPAFGVRVSWRGFLLAPDAPPEGMTLPRGVAALPSPLIEAASRAGVSFTSARPTHVPNTINAHRLVHWAAQSGLGEAAIDTLFGAYWLEGADIGATNTLADIADALGLDHRDAIAAKLQTNVDLTLVLAAHEAIREAGFSGVPVAIMNGSVLLLGAETPENYAAALDKAAAA